jgi:predicted cytidylate kinase
MAMPINHLFDSMYDVICIAKLQMFKKCVRPKDMGKLIVVGGPGGSGSSTIAKMLARYFGLHYIYGGAYMREYAKQYGFKSIGEFLIDNQTQKSQSQFDEIIDHKLIQASRWHNVLIDSKNFAALSEMMQIPTTCRVWLDASIEVRVRRTLHKQGILDLKETLSANSQMYIKTMEELNNRYELDKSRYNELYSIDYAHPSKYNEIVIDTSPYTAGQTLNLVLKELSRYV